MGYNQQDLQKILDYCRTCGDLDLVRQVIETAKGNQTKLLEIFCFSKKDALRKQRNLYKVLWFYPEIKPIVQLSVKGFVLTISIGLKNERRGRPKK